MRALAQVCEQDWSWRSPHWSHQTTEIAKRFVSTNCQAARETGRFSGVRMGAESCATTWTSKSRWTRSTVPSTIVCSWTRPARTRLHGRTRGSRRTRAGRSRGGWSIRDHRRADWSRLRWHRDGCPPSNLRTSPAFGRKRHHPPAIASRGGTHDAMSPMRHMSYVWQHSGHGRSPQRLLIISRTFSRAHRPSTLKA